MEEQVKIVDGTAIKDTGKPSHPSFSQDLLDEIDELQVESLDEKKDSKEEEEEILEEEILEEEKEESSEEEVEESKDESVEEEQEEVVDETEYLDELQDIVSDLRSAHEQVAFASESVGEKPEQPSTDEEDDPGAWSQYRIDLSTWKMAKSNYDRQAASAKLKVKQISDKQEELFIKKHDGEDVSGFRKWISGSIALQTIFFTGEKNLEQLYRMYKVDVGEESIKKKVSDLKKKGQKFKAVNTNGGSKELSAGKYPTQFKYMNLPEYKDLAKQLLSSPNPFTGKKPSLREVNDLIKNEYKYSRGKF